MTTDLEAIAIFRDVAGPSLVAPSDEVYLLKNMLNGGHYADFRVEPTSDYMDAFYARLYIENKEGRAVFYRYNEEI